ncbi:MAG: hypothetical protein M3R04_05905 [bacterium]|nr:hypothetical protein [bacterium]
MATKSYICRCGNKPLPRPKTRLLQHVGYGHSEEHSALFCADIERWPKLQDADKPVPMLFMRLDT